MKENHKAPDDIPILTSEQIRRFFTRRAWLRPRDYEQIESKSLSDAGRIRELSVFIAGYICARPKSLD